MLVKTPPAKILPSPCTAIESTLLFAFGSNESATPVVGSSRAMRLRGCPPMLVKKPPAKILPFPCSAIEWTKLFAFGSNESARPVAASSRRSEEHTSELQSHSDLVCRLLLEKKKKKL